MYGWELMMRGSKVGDDMYTWFSVFLSILLVVYLMHFIDPQPVRVPSIVVLMTSWLGCWWHVVDIYQELAKLLKSLGSVIKWLGVVILKA